MASKNTPAFPIVVGEEVVWGMSLRDYFAGQAMVAFGDRRWDSSPDETATEKAARAAYATADAMLAARNGGA